MEHQITETLLPRPGRGSDTDSYIYEFIDPKKDEIRIMSLLPGHFDDEINIQLETVCLFSDPPPHYDALSYVWGTEKCPTPALVNGKSFTITSNLDVVLRYFRDNAVAKTLWVDAVCINQKDNAEKGPQVQMMGQIYFKAAQVLIWLGPAADGSDGLLGYISSEEVEVIEQGPVDQALQDAALALMRRPWFTRMWVLQEFAMARLDPVLCCGRRTIPFSSLYRPIKSILESLEGVGLGAIERTQLKRLLGKDWHNVVKSVEGIEGLNTWDLGELRAKLLSLLLLRVLSDRTAFVEHLKELPSRVLGVPTEDGGRRVFSDGSSTSGYVKISHTDGEVSIYDDYYRFPMLLCHSAGLYATDPRDKVFGLLGMSKFLGEPILADYNKTKRQVYSEAFSVVIRNGLDVSYNMWHIAGSEKTGLPSWVPDLEHDLFGGSTTRKEDDAMKTALRSSSHGVPLATFSNDYQTLHAGGLELGCVHAAFYQPITCIVDRHEASQGESDTYEMWDEVKALIKEKNTPTRTVAYSLFKELEDDPDEEETIRVVSMICGQDDTGPREGRDRLTKDKVILVQQQAFVYCLTNTLFFTDTGRVGLIRGRVRKGDVVAALFGIGMPFVLRRDSSPSTVQLEGLDRKEQTQETSYEMVGMCHIGEHEYGHPEIPRDVEEGDLYRKYGFKTFVID
ncbi:hypothetical protein VMCG_00876 [Cytospora schulzeri]|uniref:Heterokaryon incompatibility domain-containing protein n=1 Tax=Cytospora schulzeri TaxID=448051 RepID=A0A423X5D8_9PEZI|nr:hypothetical protein VMCG_00876 [Valsa malicola]